MDNKVVKILVLGMAPLVALLTTILGLILQEKTIFTVGISIFLASMCLQAYYYYFLVKPELKKRFDREKNIAHTLSEKSIEEHEDALARNISKFSEVFYGENSSSLQKFAYQERFSMILKYLNLKNDISWADIGCNDVLLLSKGYNQNKGVKAYGLELSTGKLAIAQRRLSKQKISLHLVKGTASRLPFKDQSFDRISLTDVLEHIPKWEEVIKECARIHTRDGGIIVITTPNAVSPIQFWNLFSLLDSILYQIFPSSLKFRPLVSDHGIRTGGVSDQRLFIKDNPFIFHRDFTPRELKTELVRNGYRLKLIKSYSSSLPYGSLFKKFIRSESFLRRLFKTMNYVFLRIPIVKYFDNELVVVAYHDREKSVGKIVQTISSGGEK